MIPNFSIKVFTRYHRRFERQKRKVLSKEFHSNDEFGSSGSDRTHNGIHCATMIVGMTAEVVAMVFSSGAELWVLKIWTSNAVQCAQYCRQTFGDKAVERQSVCIPGWPSSSLSAKYVARQYWNLEILPFFTMNRNLLGDLGWMPSGHLLNKFLFLFCSF